MTTKIVFAMFLAATVQVAALSVTSMTVELTEAGAVVPPPSGSRMMVTAL